jgi:uncharacterized protein YfaT (DUF1175 family)
MGGFAVGWVRPSLEPTRVNASARTGSEKAAKRTSGAWPTRSGTYRTSTGKRIVLIALVAVAVLILLLRLAEFAGRGVHRSVPRATPAAMTSARSPAGTDRNAVPFAMTDRFGDGTPDFLRLTDPADQAAFRRWFTAIAEYQAIRPKADIPAEISDCAGLLRYAFREALERHDENWFLTTGMEVSAPPGEIRAWSYPNTPLGAALFRVRAGAFYPADLRSGAFAQFADAKTLVEHNTYRVSRDVRQALPGDLLFYSQFGQSSPWHSMIVTRAGSSAEVVYHTGPDHGEPGELRRVTLAELEDHPQPQWRPIAGNPNFLGVYRWNILRGTS